MKKILSLFLIFVITFSIIQTNAFADETNFNQSNQYADEGQRLLNSLGIETIYTDYSSGASRGEMLSLIMQLLNIKDYNTDSSPFKDISKSEPLCAYASAALSLGIISYGNSFMPNNTVSITEAAKMGVVALGYANEAILSGGYPTGYMITAQKLNLFENIDTTQKISMSVGDMYIFLKNMAETDIRVQTSFGDNSKYTTTNGVNILTYYHDLYEVEGIIEANEYTSLYDPDIKSSKNCITINSMQYKYSGNGVLGENIKAYVLKTGGIDTIIYDYSVDIKIVKINGKNVENIDGSKIQIKNDNGDKYSISVAEHPAIIYNGHASAEIAKLDYENIKESEITFISNDGGSKYNVISIMQSEPFIVSGKNILLSKLYDENGAGTLTMDDTDKTYNIIINGVKSELSEIKENTVADVYISENSTLITINISSETISGEITAYSSEGNFIYIDDVEYEYTEYFKKYYKSNASVGKNITAYLSLSDSIVAATDTLGTNSFKYGYFLQSGKGSGLDSSVFLRIFTSEGKYVIFTLADKVTIDNISGVSPNEVVSKYLTDEQLIRYDVNSEKKINKIDTEYSFNDRKSGSISATTGLTDKSVSDNDNLKRYSFPGEDGTSNVYFKYNAMHPHFSLSSSSLIFVINKELDISDEKRCMITSRSNYYTDQRFASNSIKPYNVGANGNAEVMIQFSKAEISLNNNATKFGVVQSFNHAVTPDGDSAIKLVMYTSSNQVITTYVKDMSLLDSLYQADCSKLNGDLPIGPGDIIRCSVNTLNEVAAITMDYDYSQKLVVNSFTGTNVERTYYQGYIYGYNDEDDIIFLANTKIKSKIEESEKIAVFTWGACCIYDSVKGIVYPATMSDVISYEEDPSGCDYTFLYVNWAQGKLAIIYR